MSYLVVFVVIAIVLPALSARWWWFAGLSLAAAGCWVTGVWICSEVEPGWGGLACAVLGFFGAYFVVASMAFGLFRVIKSANGTQPVEIGTLFLAGLVIYSIAGAAIYVTTLLL